MLDGKYLELFRYIYEAQTGRKTLDWDVFLSQNRSYKGRKSTNLAKWFVRAVAQDKALAFSTICRVVIFETHALGQCPEFQQQVEPRSPKVNDKFEKTLQECFKDVQNLPDDDWVGQCPGFLQ